MAPTVAVPRQARRHSTPTPRERRTATVTVGVTPNPDAYPSPGVRERVRKGPLVRLPERRDGAGRSAARLTSDPRQSLAGHGVPGSGLPSGLRAPVITTRTWSAGPLGAAPID